MAVSIKAVTITPNSTLVVGAKYTITIVAEDVTWNTIKNDFQTWDEIKTNLTNWKAVQNHI